MTTLTAFEYSGLRGRRNLADGHAYHDLPEVLTDVVTELPKWWEEAQHNSVPALERRFRNSWAEVSGCLTLHEFAEMRISPTASNSIDIVGAACRALGQRVAMVEPTFDNLALLLRRRGVPLLPVPVGALSAALAAGDPGLVLDPAAVDAVFVVSPNNPTGTDYGPEELALLADWCVRHGKILLLDNTFRFYRRAPYDDLAILRAAGVTFVSIEDTGKTWPTLDTKASPLVFSPDLAALLHELYEEVYLCTSGLSLVMLAEMLDRTIMHGLDAVVWQLVDRHRAELRAALAGGPVTVAAESAGSGLSVEWLDCAATGMDDLTVAARLRDRLGLHLLPGRAFYWTGNPATAATDRLRASLCKPEHQFADALTALAEISGALL